MTPLLPPKISGSVPRRRRWGRVVLLVLLAGIGVWGWHYFTGQRALRQLREAGFYKYSEDVGLRARLREAARRDWRQLFQAGTWDVQNTEWTMDSVKRWQLRNLNAVASSLRRVNPAVLYLNDCAALQNVNGLKGITKLRKLSLTNCQLLRNVDALKSLTALDSLYLCDCPELQDVNGLKGLTKLQQLSLESNRSLKNVDGLDSLTGLQRLSLDNCRALQNVDGLKGLAGLQRLSLVNCVSLQNMNGLKGLTGLQQLSLNHSGSLRDADCLKNLVALQELHLAGWLTLQNVDGLKGLTALRILDLRGCAKLPPEQVAALKAAIPNATVLHP